MTPETLLLGDIEEKDTAASKSVEPASEDVVNLKEDTTLQGVGTPPLGERLRRSDLLSEGEANKEVEGAIRILFDGSATTVKSHTPFRGSLEALSELRSSTDAADWIETALVLKRDVVRLRDTNYSRHAAVLLAIADALAFTEPAEVSSAEALKRVVGHALGLLSEPFISEASEEEFLGDLLISGWNLVPSHEQSAEPVG